MEATGGRPCGFAAGRYVLTEVSRQHRPGDAVNPALGFERLTAQGSQFPSRKGALVGSILNEADRTEIRERIGSVTSASRAHWGRMDAKAMLTHLRNSAQMALGELPVASKSKRVFQVFPLKNLILYVVPFPKGAPTAPELLGSDAAPLEAIREELASLVERIGAGPREGQGPIHPLLGRLSFREWGVVTYKHTDHHLRQFGA